MAIEAPPGIDLQEDSPIIGSVSDRVAGVLFDALLLARAPEEIGEAVKAIRQPTNAIRIRDVAVVLVRNGVVDGNPSDVRLNHVISRIEGRWEEMLAGNNN